VAGHVTIQVLAKQLGISKASVSYALNGQPGVSDVTRERVLALAGELGWRPSSTARALSRSRADAIGMVLKRDPAMLGSEPYYMQMLEGVEDVLSREERSLLLRMVGTAPGRDVEVYRQWSAERRVDGVIVFDLAVDDTRPALLRSLDMPFVLHGVRRGERPGSEQIEDQGRDATLIVDHLAALGHREILHVTGPQFLAHEVDRRRSIEQEAAAHGIRTRFIECDYTMGTAQRMVTELVKAGTRATALVASNDLMALGTLGALRGLGRAEQLALISWDDSMICQIATPSVTALSRHPDEQGRRSARMLLQLLDTGTLHDGPVIRSDLVVRDTSVRLS
jgi:DNA-binding LacI/PurR family transcriptional regulator